MGTALFGLTLGVTHHLGNDFMSNNERLHALRVIAFMGVNKGRYKLIFSNTVHCTVLFFFVKNIYLLIQYKMDQIINNTQFGCIIDTKKNPIDNSTIRRLKNKFTIKTKIAGFYNQISCITVHKNFIILPRFSDHEKMFTIINKIPETNNINFNFTGNLINNQKIINDEIIKTYNNNIKNGLCGLILKMKAGQGKTYVAMNLIKTLSKKTVIIVHNSALLLQWKDMLLKNFMNIKIGLLHKDEKSDGDIVICIINSLLKDNIIIDNKTIPIYDYFKDVGFCIFDECHLMCSKERKEIFKYCQVKYMLGLSATPNRIDKIESIIKWNIGPIFNASDYVTFDDVKFEAKIIAVKYYGPNEYCRYHINESTGMINNSKMIEQLTLDQIRNQIIIEFIKKFTFNNNNIFVFADRREYLINLQKQIIQSFTIKPVIIESDEEVAKLFGGSTDEEIKRAENKSKIILTTYQYMGTGKSIPKMDTLILATPRKHNSEQYVNRIFRLDGNNTICRNIVDIIDYRSSVKTQWYERKKYYDDCKYPIKYLTIDSKNNNDISLLVNDESKYETQNIKTNKKSNIKVNKKINDNKDETNNKEELNLDFLCEW